MNSTTTDIELTASKNEESTKEDDEELTASKNEESTKEDDEYMNDVISNLFPHNRVEMNSTTTDIELTASKNEESTKEDDEETYMNDDVISKCSYDGVLGWFEYKRDWEWIPLEMKEQIAFHKHLAVFYHTYTNTNFRDRNPTSYSGVGQLVEMNGEKVKINLGTLCRTYRHVMMFEREKYMQGESPSGENIVVLGGVVQHRNQSFSHVRFVMCPILGLKKRERKSILQKKRKLILRKVLHTHKGPTTPKISSLIRRYFDIDVRIDEESKELGAAVWSKFRTIRKSKVKRRFERFHYKMMYYCLTHLQAQDLVQLQQVSRTFYIVTREKSLWNVLAQLRKKRIAMYAAQYLSAREFLFVDTQYSIMSEKDEEYRKNLSMNGKALSEYRNSWLCFCFNITDFSRVQSACCYYGAYICVFTVVGITSFVLFSIDLDDKSSDKMLLPSLATFAANVLLGVGILCTCVVLLTFVLWSDDETCGRSHILHTISGLSSIPKRDFQFAVVWYYLIRMLVPLCFGFFTWFVVNLLRLAGGGTGDFESYVDVFQPLYCAEGCAMILIIVMGIFLARTSYGHNSDRWSRELFNRARSIVPSIILSLEKWLDLFCLWCFAFVWIVCLSVFSILLPLKLDDGIEEESYTWNEVFLPIWCAYVVQFLLISYQSYKDPSSTSCDALQICGCYSFVCFVPTVISILLIQLKLTYGGELDISWVSALAPIFVQFFLFCVQMSKREEH